VIEFPELGLRQVPILHPLLELGREREREMVHIIMTAINWMAL